MTLPRLAAVTLAVLLVTGCQADTTDQPDASIDADAEHLETVLPTLQPARDVQADPRQPVARTFTESFGWEDTRGELRRWSNDTQLWDEVVADRRDEVLTELTDGRRGVLLPDGSGGNAGPFGELRFVTVPAATNPDLVPFSLQLFGEDDRGDDLVLAWAGVIENAGTRGELVALDGPHHLELAETTFDEFEAFWFDALNDLVVGLDADGRITP